MSVGQPRSFGLGARVTRWLPPTVVRYLFAVAAVAVAFGLGLRFVTRAGTGALGVLLSFAAVLVTSVVAGAGPALFAVAISIPIAAYVLVAGAGSSIAQATAQAALVALDGLVVVYLARRASSARRHVSERSPDAFLVTDRDARITDVSAAACKMLGYERDQLVGKTMLDFVARDVTERKRLEEELREAEERFRLAIDEAPIAMAICALDGRYLRVNHVLCEIVGYTPAELTGMSFRAITHPDDVDTDVSLAEQLARGEIPRYGLEKRYVRKDGSLVEVMLHRSIVRRPDGAPLYYIVQAEDITERKRAERVSQQLATIVRHSNDAITTHDLDGNILTWNRCAERIYGYTEAEALEMKIAALVPEGNTEALAYLDAIRRGEEVPSVEVKRRAKDGRILDVWLTTAPLFEDDHPVAVATTERDISERKQRERERQYNLDAMERIFRVSSLFLTEQPPQAILHELLDTAIAICHADFGNIQVLDPATSGLEVVAQRNLPDWWLAFWAGVVRGHGACGTALAGGKRVVVEDVTQSAIFVGTEALDIQLRAGIRAVQSTPLISRSGAPIGMISTHWKTPHRMGEQTLQLLDLLARRAADILERVQMEAALRSAIHARDQVLGVVAHDLRNPLTLIMMQSKLLHRRGPEPERRNQKPAELIARAAARMNRLIQDLLDVTRIESGQLHIARTRSSAAAVAAEAVDTQLALAASASIDLRLDVASELPEVWADRERLLQVFENLIGNAIKFTPSGGQIRVGAEQRDGEVLFWVKDTGTGISAEDLPHLFDRFWQAAANAGRLGAGLGLPITKGIVEAHGGHIWAESTAGQGTRFYFSIPTARPEGDRTASYLVH